MEYTYSSLISMLKSKTAEEDLKKISEEIKNEKGLNYPDGLRIVERFMGALFTNQLIILSGPPGTGKTSLPFAVAATIGAECIPIYVQPNWTDNQDLMGYYNPIKDNNKGGYTSTPFLDALWEASKNKDKIYFIVLDEMNLAHIEYYFSTMLSVMETEKKEIVLYSEHLKSGENEIPAILELPENLQIIGTLNMDETTKGISPKVIDRSYILEIPGKIEIEHDEDTKMKDSDFDDLESEMRELLDINLSFRLKKHYETMSEREFLNVDDFIAGKVLPMIRDKKYEEEPDLSEYAISENKIVRMTQKNDENEVKLDFWGND